MKVKISNQKFINARHKNEIMERIFLEQIFLSRAVINNILKDKVVNIKKHCIYPKNEQKLLIAKTFECIRFERDLKEL